MIPSLLAHLAECQSNKNINMWAHSLWLPTHAPSERRCPGITWSINSISSRYNLHARGVKICGTALVLVPLIHSVARKWGYVKGKKLKQGGDAGLGPGLSFSLDTSSLQETSKIPYSSHHCKRTWWEAGRKSMSDSLTVWGYRSCQQGRHEAWQRAQEAAAHTEPTSCPAHFLLFIQPLIIAHDMALSTHTVGSSNFS